MSYIPLTDSDTKLMLETAGAATIDELFADIPEHIRIAGELPLPDALSQMQADKKAVGLAEKNSAGPVFAGAGIYDHYVPAVVDYLSSRSEFLTAYTPYQPEVSQGTLTAIFEFQTMICSLTGMEVANASMYDGSTALAESALMARAHTGKKRFVVSGALNMNYRQVLKTYSEAAGLEIQYADAGEGVTSVASIEQIIDENTAAVIVQNPNFYGSIEDLKKLVECAKKSGALFIVSVVEAMSLGLLKSPGDCGADIVCGEAQSFGNYPSFGGPLLGFIAASKAFTRKMPGRLVGKTADAEGREAYVLTLQTREQHIRRENATSNICSNEGHLALRTVIYLSLLGPKLRDTAILNHSLAVYLQKKLINAGLSIVFQTSFFNEFVLKSKNALKLINGLSARGYTAGVELSAENGNENCILFCATEKLTKEDIDAFACEVERIEGGAE